jgi:hypothetical protein
LILGLHTYANISLANVEEYSNNALGFNFEQLDDWDMVNKNYAQIKN